MHYIGYHQSQQEKEHRLPNHTFSQVHRSKQVFSYQSQIIPFFTSFLLCGKKLSHTSFQIFLKVALTYPLLITAYFIFMAVFLPKAISLPRKPRSQASRSGLMGHVQTRQEECSSTRSYSSCVHDSSHHFHGLQDCQQSKFPLLHFFSLCKE